MFLDADAACQLRGRSELPCAEQLLKHQGVGYADGAACGPIPYRGEGLLCQLIGLGALAYKLLRASVASVQRDRDADVVGISCGDFHRIMLRYRHATGGQIVGCAFRRIAHLHTILTLVASLVLAVALNRFHDSGAVLL